MTKTHIFRAVIVVPYDTCPDRETYEAAVEDAVAEARTLEGTVAEYGPQVMAEAIAIHRLENPGSTPRAITTKTAAEWLQ